MHEYIMYVYICVFVCRLSLFDLHIALLKYKVYHMRIVDFYGKALI